MVKGINDTSYEAQDIQIRLLRQASPARRVELVRSLSKSMIMLSRRGLSRRNRSLSSMDIDILFLDLIYGTDLAERVRRYLKKERDE